MTLKVSEWSVTPSSNTSIDGVSIAENCPIANLNNSDRALMAAVRLEVASIGSNISAAGTMNLDTVGGALTVVGVTTIEGFATAPAGLLRVLHFETATPIVPGANLSAEFSSLTTTKGGVMAVRSLGAAAWKVEYSSDYLSGISTVGKHKLWIPAAAMRPQTGSSPASSDNTSSNVQYYTLDFDQSAVEGAFFNISMPSSADETAAITFVPVWTAASGSGDVVWRMYAWAFGNDDTLSAAFGTLTEVTDTLLATNDLHRGPESGALTITNTWAANDTLVFAIFRAGSDGDDTLNADAKLLGVEMYITTNAATDVP